MGERTYKDSDGRECSLQVLCRREPEWAASRIAALEARNAEHRELLDAAFSELVQAYSTLAGVQGKADPLAKTITKFDRFYEANSQSKED